MLHLKTFRTWSIGWVLYGVNFRPLQEIEAIMGGGRIFDTFSQSYGITIPSGKVKANLEIYESFLSMASFHPMKARYRSI